MKSLIKNPKILFKQLSRLQAVGKYGEALDELRDIWFDTSKLPVTDSFDPPVKAEILLICGSLIGFHGHNKQIPNAQEISKNLLTKARQAFLDGNSPEKVAECCNYLALAYWRTGEFVEARTWIEESIAQELPGSHETRIFSYIIESKVDFAEKKYLEICDKFATLSDRFLQCSKHNLIGDYYNQLGLAFANLGKNVDAVENLRLAKYFHSRSGHQIYLGAVENNLALLYKLENDFGRAHESIDTATAIFVKIDDKTRHGFSLDTKAQVYIAEGKTDEALETVDAALILLEKTENLGYLVETFATKTKILLALDDFTAATFCLFDAVQIARSKISEQAATDLISQFENEIKQRSANFAGNLLNEHELISGKIEFALPPSISHFRDYRAVRIRNSHLEQIGLKLNSLAIVADEIVNRGDIAAVMEIQDESIYCGVFDSDFGIICLEGFESEPQLLNESEVKILGKIVGVSDGTKDRKGKLIVKAL